MEHPPLVLFYYGFQLVYVADEQELFAAERLAHVARIHAQHLVDEVYYVGTHHAYLVDDDKLYLAQYLALLRRVFQRGAQVAHGIARVVGQQGVERQLEEAVQRCASCVYGGYARRCEYDVLLLRCGADMA